VVPLSSQFKNYISSIPLLRKLQPFVAVPKSSSAYSLGEESKVDEDFQNSSTNANPVNDSVKMPNNLPQVHSATSPTNKKSFFEETDLSSNVDRIGSVSNFQKDPLISSEITNVHTNVAESTVERRPSINYSNLTLHRKRTSLIRAFRRLKCIRNVNTVKKIPISRIPFGCSVHVIDNSKNKTQRSSSIATVSPRKQKPLPLISRGRYQKQPGPDRSESISRNPPEKMRSVRYSPVFEASRHSSDLEHRFIKGT
jgi:hypothetical protein